LLLIKVILLIVKFDCDSANAKCAFFSQFMYWITVFDILRMEEDDFIQLFESVMLSNITPSNVISEL